MKTENTDTQSDSDAVNGRMKRLVSPLSPSKALRLANKSEAYPIDETLATFADARNWTQIYGGHTSPVTGYEAKPCEWIFIGGFRPPYEVAQHALKDNGYDDVIG